MDKLNVTFCSFPDYSSNAKPLYEYMKERYKEQMNFSWVVNTQEMKEKLESMGIETYLIRTDEFYAHMKEVNVIFSTHCNLMGYKPQGATYIELWHGISSKNVGFLSDNITDSDIEWYSYAKEQVDYIIVPSEFWRVIFATRFDMNYNKILSLGYPKLDSMKDKNAKEKLQKVLGEDVDVSSYDKILYYMPTFRKGCGRKVESEVNLENIFNIQKYDEDRLLKHLEEKNCLVCVKKHPNEELDMKEIDSKYIKVIQEKSLQDNNITVNEILDAADVMITDYSSLGIEFLFLDKPVIYLVNDLEEYTKNRGFTFNNLDFWMPGNRVKNLYDLIEAIDGSIVEDFKYKEEFAKKKKLWFSNLEDGGCKNICDYFFEGDKLKKEIIDEKPSPIHILKERVEELSRTVDEKNAVIAQREARIKELDDFIAQIINSKGWKFLEGMRNIKKKLSGKK